MVEKAVYRVVLVVKRTRYESAGAEAKRLVREGDPSVAGWVAAHDRHHASLEMVEKAIQREELPYTVVRSPYEAFDTSRADVVIVVGGDGTFLAASHSVWGVPMIGVNSDPKSSRGFFCGATAETFKDLLNGLVRGVASMTTVQRMEVQVDGSTKSKRVLNEALVCHPHPAATSRFSVSFGGREHAGGQWESQMSSGAWVGPPAGTTGAMRSAGGDLLPLEARLMQYVSRETVHGMSRKVVTPDPVLMRVKTDTAAVYMDGPYKWADLRLGQTVRLSLSSEPLTVVGVDGRR